MIRVIDEAGELVEENSLRFLEGDTVLRQVGASLVPIPGKLNIAHSIILAIPDRSGHLPRAIVFRQSSASPSPSTPVRPPLSEQSRNVRLPKEYLARQRFRIAPEQSCHSPHHSALSHRGLVPSRPQFNAPKGSLDGWARCNTMHLEGNGKSHPILA